MLPGAVADATARALGVFKREGGKLVPRKADGSLLYIDNKQADLGSWLASLRGEGAGHWFKAPASGSGAGGNLGGDGGGSRRTITRAEYDAMAPEDRHKFMTVDRGKVVDP